MIIQQGYQRSAFLNSTNNISVAVYSGFNNITQYFGLRKTNEILSEENALLRQKLLNLSSRDTLMGPSCNLFSKDSAFMVIPAKVISNSIHKQKNYLLINVGKNEGIGPDMAVITSGGVVGQVVFASEKYSTVMSMLHRDMRINARVKKNNHLGNLQWDGMDYRHGILTDIPSHVSLDMGDTIVTSGNSFIFPENLLIGTVEDYMSIKGENFNKARVGFTVDFNRLTFVYVIKNHEFQNEFNTYNRTDQ